MEFLHLSQITQMEKLQCYNSEELTCTRLKGI